MSKPLGLVTSEPEPPSTTYCWLILTSIDVVKKGAFVTIQDARNRNVRFVGQVVEVINYSDVLGEASREEMLRSGRMAEDILKGSLTRPEYLKALAKVKLMYKVIDSIISSVDVPPTDTSPLVELALGDLPAILGFSADPRSTICLGTLYAHSNISACFDLNRMLQGHIAIFGQTGSGKSYAAGVIVEEVVDRGVPVLVFDHMGEYLSMDKAVDGSKGLNLIRLEPGVNLTIDFDDLMKAQPILTALGITDAQLNLLRDAYTEALNHGLRGVGAIKWLLQDIRDPQRQRVVKRLYLIGRSRGYSVASIDGLRWKLESLLSKGIIGSGFNIANVIKPGHLTVVDLTTVDYSERSLIVATILNKIVELRTESVKKNLNIIPPLLVVVEEAHNYIPFDETPSSVMIRNLIRGARHFGVSVMLISQRPSGIHRDAINIVNTHIIFRLKGTDLEYIKQFTPFTKEELEDIQVLPEGVAYITGPIVRGGLSIKVSVRKRRTVHGGQSIKFV